MRNENLKKTDESKGNMETGMPRIGFFTKVSMGFGWKRKSLGEFTAEDQKLESGRKHWLEGEKRWNSFLETVDLLQRYSKYDECYSLGSFGAGIFNRWVRLSFQNLLSDSASIPWEKLDFSTREGFLKIYNQFTDLKGWESLLAKLSEFSELWDWFHPQTHSAEEKNPQGGSEKTPQSETGSRFNESDRKRFLDKAVDQAYVLGDILYKIYKKTRENTGESRYEIKSQIRSIRIYAAVILAILGLSIGVYRWIQFPELKDDQVQIYFLNQEISLPKPQAALISPFSATQRGQWSEHEFWIPEYYQNLTGIRLDPLNQRRMKVRLGRLEVWAFRENSKNSYLAWSRDFVLNSAGTLDDIESIGDVGQMEISSAKPGSPIELLTTGGDPHIYLRFPREFRVQKIRVKLKALEAYSNFKD
jgi:hypothetical protein